MLTFKNMGMGMELVMGPPLSRLVLAFLFVAIGLHATNTSDLVAAELKPKTLETFNRYVALAEARMKRDESHPNDFLYIETLPRPDYDSIMETLRQGQVYVQPFRILEADGESIDVPDGMIHHWVGDVFIPGKSVASVLNIL